MATDYGTYEWPSASGSGVTIYPTLADFPASAPVGTLAVAADTGTVYVFYMGTWVPIGGPGDVLSVGTIDSNGASANGASINSLSQLIMQSASATAPGLVNNTTQSFSGNKTFTGTLAASNLSGTNTGNVTIGTANGLSLTGQALSLGLASTSTTGALSSTDWNTFNSKQTALAFSDSLVNTAGTVTLVNDTATPGDNYYYGTSSLGTLGYQPASPTGGTSNLAMRDSNGNVFANNFVPAFGLIPTTGGTTALTASSPYYELITGTLTEIITLPDATSLPEGFTFLLLNNSTANVTVNNASGTLIRTMPTGDTVFIVLATNGSIGGQWGPRGFLYAVNGTSSTSMGLEIAGYVSGSSLISTGFAGGHVLISSGTIVAESTVTTTTLGYLDATSSIQTQLNSKQAAGNYITALTGDVTASGPGSVAATLATVNANVGSFTSANITVNAKGLITAASNGTGASYASGVWDRVVGSSAQVTSGRASDSSIASAITNASAGQTIFILPGTYTENPTIGKQLTFQGAGAGATISGNVTFATSSDETIFENLRITGTITVNSGVTKLILDKVFCATANALTDNSGSNTNYYGVLMEEN